MDSRPQTSSARSSRGFNSYALGGFVGVLLGTLLGGLGGVFFPRLFYKLTNPLILQDGQWGMVFLVSIPAGLLIGLTIGLMAGLWLGHKVK